MESIKHFFSSACKESWILKPVRALYSFFLYLKSFPIADAVNIEKRKLISTVRPYSLLPYQKLSQIYDLIKHLEKNGIEGNLVECGVCNGGTSGLIAAVSHDQAVWLFDSWEGCPQPGILDITFGGQRGTKGECLGSLEKVEELMSLKLKIKHERIHIERGWFQETLPRSKSKIGKIAFLHLDGDWYDSIKVCLEELYDQVVTGGIIVIDDYAFYLGCKKAVDEFISDKKNVSIKTIPFSCTYIIKN